MFGNAEACERFMGRWSRLVVPLLVEFAEIRDTGQVLDVGAGTGALTFEIARRRPAVHVTGIDPSQEYVSFAISRKPFPDRATFQRGDAQHLTFANGTFAASLSLLAFNFISDPAKALQQIRCVCIPALE